MSANALAAVLPPALVELAALVRAEHQAATVAMKRGFEHFIRAGELLIAATAQVAHGEWKGWLQLTGMPQRTATRYMEFARNRAVFLDQNGHVADLTVQRAFDLLAGTAGKCKRRGDPADLNKLFEYPPITVFDARTEYWQARKRAWIALGIQSELGRDGIAFKGQSGLNDLLFQHRGLAAVLQRDKAKAA